MIKKISILVISLSLFSSCVSKKIYTELEDKYANLKKEHRQISDENQSLTESRNTLLNDLEKLNRALDIAVKERDQLRLDIAATKTNLANLKASYKALEENSSASIAANSKKNRELLAQLEAKEQALAAESERLSKLEKELQSRSQRVAELENVIASKA